MVDRRCWSRLAVLAGILGTDIIHRFRLWDKLRALEMLAKHYALLTDVMRVEQQTSLEQRLLLGRQRVAEARNAREKA